MKWQKSNNQKCHSSQVCHKFRAKWDEELCDTQTQALQTSPKVWTLDPEEKNADEWCFFYFFMSTSSILFGFFLELWIRLTAVHEPVWLKSDVNAIPQGVRLMQADKEQQSQGDPTSLP